MLGTPHTSALAASLNDELVGEAWFAAGVRVVCVCAVVAWPVVRASCRTKTPMAVAASLGKHKDRDTILKILQVGP